MGPQRRSPLASLGLVVGLGSLVLVATILAAMPPEPRPPSRPPPGPAAGGAVGRTGEWDRAITDNARRLAEEGRRIFRHDTFGDEQFWGDTLKLHRAIAGERLGGLGAGLSPSAAVGLGLKVDVDSLPANLVAQLRRGEVNLDDPATTIALLRLGAVVGVTGFVDATGGLASVGIQCALCHSTVDDSFAPGIGQRLDGWPNRDLDVGAIIALAPDLQFFADALGVDQASVRVVLRSWGPGKYDAELNLDGKVARPDGRPAATLLPPIFGLAGVGNQTWTGAWGSMSYWNAYVANLQMHGKGTFLDARLDDAVQFPVAAREGYGRKRDAEDLITSKLAALQFYQLAIPTPRPPAGAFDATRVPRGLALFSGKARCASCHVPPIFTEPGWNLHRADEIGIDDFQSSRAPDRRYRTTPLRALWDVQKIHRGGFYHDGRFATLGDVVSHYDAFLGLGLTLEEQADLIEYLKSL